MMSTYENTTVIEPETVAGNETNTDIKAKRKWRPAHPELIASMSRDELRALAKREHDALVKNGYIKENK